MELFAGFSVYINIETVRQLEFDEGCIYMGSCITPIVLGILISILGIFNRRGNISSIHWYHRQRVTDENMIPFGKKIGLGTIIIGISIIVFGVLSLVTKLTRLDLFVTIGAALVVMGIVVGIILSLHAMIKYNKGIF